MALPLSFQFHIPPSFRFPLTGRGKQYDTLSCQEQEEEAMIPPDTLSSGVGVEEQEEEAAIPPDALSSGVDEHEEEEECIWEDLEHPHRIPPSGFHH